MDVKVLRQIIVKYFNEEDLRTLCFDLRIDYDSLPANGKAGKARELVLHMEREIRLPELLDEIKKVRPWLVPALDSRRLTSARQRLLADLQPSLLNVFHEFTAQVDAYLTQLTQLHSELEEWKNLHNMLHHLHSSFGLCHSYAMQIEDAAQVNQRHQERWIYRVEGSWKGCSRFVRIDVKTLAQSVQWISEPYNQASGDGPEWFLKLHALSANIDDILKENDVSKVDFSKLANALIAFDDVIEEWLLRADTNLREVVRKVSQMERSLPFWDKRDE